MHWNDYGFLLSKEKYSENAISCEIFTKDHGKVSGIIYGGTSRKNKNYLQIGNLLHINYSSKNESRLGSIKSEIFKVISPLFFDNEKKLLCLRSSINLIKTLTVESQINEKIYFLIEKLFLILSNDLWFSNYIFWELEFFKLIGYNLEFKNLVKEEIVDNKKIYFVLSNQQKKLIPNFLVENNFNEINKESLLSALKLNSDYLDKTILKPNNIPTPKSRNDLINLIKK